MTAPANKPRARGGKWVSGDEPSANPTPTCRKGHCGTLAAPDSEWCAEHGTEIAVRQAQAQTLRNATSRRVGQGVPWARG